MILHFLSLRCRSADQRSAAEEQVLSLFVKVLVNKEIFLFGTDRRVDVCDIFIAEKMQHSHSRFADSFHRTKKRCLLVQCLSAVGAERCRNIKSSILNESRRRRIPCRIASCLESCAKSSRREAGRIRLALYKLFSGEIKNHAAVAGRGNKAVMLLSRKSCQRLEPVCEMRRTMLNCPVLHNRSNCICNVEFEM